MEECTLNLLIAYVIALVQREGIKAVHSTQLIPAGRTAPHHWTQFPTLSEDQTKRLDLCGVTYDRYSGWFRKKA